MAMPAPSPRQSPSPGEGPSRRQRPRAATYRVQLHAGFTFDDAAAIAGYLAELGVSHLYCSPYLQAAAGSTHGYDVVDHGRLNGELGGADGYRRLAASLAGAGLGQVLDIVPNHMALAGRANAWWWDVLENGPSSRVRRLLRHRLGSAAAQADRHRADAGARRPLRPGPRGRAS